MPHLWSNSVPELEPKGRRRARCAEISAAASRTSAGVPNGSDVPWVNTVGTVMSGRCSVRGRSSRLRIDFRQFVGDEGSKVAGLSCSGSPAQILVRMWTKGRSRLAERCCAATTMVNADTSSRAETKGQSHRQIDVRDPGRGGRSYMADRYLMLPEGPPLPGKVPAAA